MLNKLKQLWRWVADDGLLHFLVCYAMMLALTPIIGIWWTLLTTTLIALAKEAWDYFYQKDNNKEQVIHDLICDASGMLGAVVTMVLWWVYNL